MQSATLETESATAASPAGTSSSDSQLGLGAIALASLLARDGARRAAARRRQSARAAGSRTFAAKAKRVIYLHMTGSPPHLDLFDYKPELVKRDGQDCPDAFLEGQAVRVHHRRAEAAGHAAEVRAARRGRRVDVRRGAAPARASPTSCASSSR